MKTTTRLTLAAVTALLLSLAGTGTASAASWQYFNVDSDRYVDAAAIDRDANGNFDDIYFDLDNDDEFDTNVYNKTGADTLLEIVDYDMDENDEVEIRLADGDQRVGFDYIWVDLDQNGYWDRFRYGARRIIPGSNVDVITRTTRYNASTRLINDFRAQTGTSLLYPSFPTCC